MNASEIRQLADAEIVAKIKEEQMTLQRMKMAHAVSPIENPNRLRLVKKTIARLKTVLTERAQTQN